MKIAVAVSGGVDSAVAAALLKEQGHNIIGVTMQHFNNAEYGFPEDKGISVAVKDARQVCDSLKIEHFVYDTSEQFKKIVEKIQPDLIHAGPIQTVALLPVLVGFHPLISMSWGFDMLEDANRNWFWKAITRYVLGKSDWLFADCHTVKKMAVKFDFPKENITVFP